MTGDDALGRMVEQNTGSGYVQVVYTPTGQKFALMNGQTVSKAFVALPGGAQAVYLGTTLTYFRHPDWLGSARLTSTAAQGWYSDSSYAPFGEPYPNTTAIDVSFTGQNQDTVQGNAAGLNDFLFRRVPQVVRISNQKGRPQASRCCFRDRDRKKRQPDVRD